MNDRQVFRLRIEREDAQTLFLTDARGPLILTSIPDKAVQFGREGDVFSAIASVIRSYANAEGVCRIKQQIFTDEQTACRVHKATVYIDYARVIEGQPRVWCLHHRGGIHIPVF